MDIHNLWTEKTIKLNKIVLNFIFILALLILGLISFFAYSELNSLTQANKLVAHTYQVIGKIDLSLYSLSEIESKQRAYLISGNSNFLNEMVINKSHLEASLKDAYELTQDDLDRNNRIRRYSKLIQERLLILQRLIDLKTKGKLNTSEGLAVFAQGNELSIRIKDLAQEIKSIEKVLLKERNQLTLQKALSSNILLISGSILSFIFLIIPFVLINKELVNRQLIELNDRSTKTYLRQIIESTNDMIAVFDAKNELLIFNEAYHREFKRFFGKSITIGMSLDDVLAEIPANKQALLQRWKNSLHSANEVKTMEFEHEQGKNIYELSSREITNEYNETTGIVHSMRDISNRVKEHLKLQESYEKQALGMKKLQVKNQQITLLVDMSDILLAAKSQEELGKALIKYAAELLSFSQGDLFIMHPSKNYLEKVASWGASNHQKTLFSPDQCWGIRLGHAYYVDNSQKKLICEHIELDGNSDSTLICVPLMAQNDIYGLLYMEVLEKSFVLDADLQLIINAFTELTALALANVRLRENLHYQSIRDPLTRLYNRRYLDDALYKQIYHAEHSKTSFAILMLDLDHFKKVNDIFGHDAGDAVLKGIGEVFEGTIKIGDVAARYGGEEFIVMLQDVDLEKAKARAEDIRLAVSKLQIKYGIQHIGPVTLSIGIAIYPSDQRDKDELIELADKALYVAKKSGRNKIVAFSEIEGV